MLQNKKSAFTLIELLAAILIGSILLTSLSGIYKHMRNSVSVKEEKNYMYESSLHFFNFFRKDIKSAGYEEYGSINGEILNSFTLDDKGTTSTLDDEVTIVYDLNETIRITNVYTYDNANNKILVNNIPLVSKVSDINWTIDSTNSKRFITNVTFTGNNTNINGNQISKSFKSVNYYE